MFRLNVSRVEPAGVCAVVLLRYSGLLTLIVVVTVTFVCVIITVTFVVGICVVMIVTVTLVAVICVTDNFGKRGRPWVYILGGRLTTVIIIIINNIIMWYRVVGLLLR